MKSPRILHVSSDNRFIDQAWNIFEIVFPGSNDVIVFSLKCPLEKVKLLPKQVIIPSRWWQRHRPKLNKEIYEQYDLIILHCLSDAALSEISVFPKDKPIIWLGWGFDYYEYILDEELLLLPETLKLSNESKLQNVKKMVVRKLKRSAGVVSSAFSKKRAIERINIFCPVLPDEYDLVSKSRQWTKFPDYGSWNYGTIEDDFIKGFEDKAISGDSILIGNSASLTCNHIESLKILFELGLTERKIIAPLSYGDRTYADNVSIIGKDYFGTSFEPLMSFIPIQDYVAKIKECGYVVMNHRRQQAVGNIVIMLYIGARVFVRRENPVYGFFKKMGVTISTVQELDANPALLRTPLSSQERETNRRLVSDYWSRVNAMERTKRLVEQALAISGVKAAESASELAK